MQVCFHKPYNFAVTSVRESCVILWLVLTFVRIAVLKALCCFHLALSLPFSLEFLSTDTGGEQTVLTEIFGWPQFLVELVFPPKLWKNACSFIK